jgi:L-asparaginase / beta-aspartyl-peptidase
VARINCFLGNLYLILQDMTGRTSIAIHGGAGTIERGSLTPELEQEYFGGLKRALMAGDAILKKGGSSVDAVVAAVIALEDFPLFNAGKGAVFNHLGGHEMDAAVMDGLTLDAGAVCGVRHVRNPVVLANAVMQKSDHVILAGEGAELFAKSLQLPFENDEYFYTEARYQQWKKLQGSEVFEMDHTPDSKNKMGTVGAVALDIEGNLSAATSTGGMTNKKFGRIGDTPLIGAGTYANNRTCAISCTGHGELFIRSVVAYDISCLMEYKGLTLKQACEEVVMDKLVKINGEGGLIAVDAAGNIEMPFNSEGMYRACIDQSGKEFYGIYK